MGVCPFFKYCVLVVLDSTEMGLDHLVFGGLCESKDYTKDKTEHTS